ncbi:MAG: MerR family transcriptional regulator [Planctomycetes bacterium]|nr:MerR family transcriptional regulator [Planctomycetota bacterium]
MRNRGKLDVYLSRIGDLGNLGASGHDGAAVPLPRKLYRVSEIADHLGVTRQTLHNYAIIGLITEERRTDGGQRLFDESVFARLAIIQRLKRNHRLHEIRRMMEEGAAGRGSGVEAAEPLSSRSREVAGGREVPPASAQRTSLERLQELTAAARLSDEIETAAARPVAGLPQKSPPEEVAGHSAPSPHISGEAVVGPDVAVRAPFEPSPGSHEDQAPTDDKAQS